MTALPSGDDAITRTLPGPHRSTATLHPLGAMLAPVAFRSPDLPDFAPMQVAPWLDEAGWDALVPGLRSLRGEWPCVPFGRVDRPADLPRGWLARQPGDAWGHGYAMHHAWRWIDDDGGGEAAGLGLVIEPPPSDEAPITRLERRARWLAPDPIDGAVSLESTLRIDVARDVVCPVALHPTLRLDAGRVHLRLPGHAGGWTYPVPAEPESSRLEADAGFTSLDAVPLAAHARHGSRSTADLTRYPQPDDSEELLQVLAPTGPLHADYLDLGWSLEIDWDRTLLPDVMLWVSHGGRRYPPWNGRHRAIGIEPVAGPFDLGRIASPPSSHPMASRRGLALRAEHPTTLGLRLTARPLGPASR